jgi:hypothetical protein
MPAGSAMGFDLERAIRTAANWREALTGADIVG